MKKIIIILIAFLAISCAEKIETGPYTYTGEVFKTEYIPSRTYSSYSHTQERMVVRTEPSKHYVYYDFLGENRVINSTRLFESCGNSVDITYNKLYRVKKEIDTIFVRNKILKIK